MSGKKLIIELSVKSLAVFVIFAGSLSLCESRIKRQTYPYYGSARAIDSFPSYLGGSLTQNQIFQQNSPALGSNLNLQQTSSILSSSLNPQTSPILSSSLSQQSSPVLSSNLNPQQSSSILSSNLNPQTSILSSSLSQKSSPVLSQNLNVQQTSPVLTQNQILSSTPSGLFPAKDLVQAISMVFAMAYGDTVSEADLDKDGFITAAEFDKITELEATGIFGAKYQGILRNSLQSYTRNANIVSTVQNKLAELSRAI